jgi:Ca2+-binding EF-hand superfamily protein
MAESQLTRELTKEELQEFRSAFDMFDIDGGGTCHYFILVTAIMAIISFFFRKITNICICGNGIFSHSY